MKAPAPPSPPRTPPPPATRPPRRPRAPPAPPPAPPPPQILAPSQTTFYEGDPKEITGLHTEALGVLFPVDSMDSCEEMMIQDWPGALYKKDDTAFLCWTYSPEVTYVLEYTPSHLDDSEIIKMAESADPVN